MDRASTVRDQGVQRRDPGAIELRLHVEAAAGVANSGDPEQDLVELLEEIVHAATANRIGALFLIDEMQNLDTKSLSAICLAFQMISRESRPVAMVGAGLPQHQFEPAGGPLSAT